MLLRITPRMLMEREIPLMERVAFHKACSADGIVSLESLLILASNEYKATELGNIPDFKIFWFAEKFLSDSDRRKLNDELDGLHHLSHAALSEMQARLIYELMAENKQLQG